VGVMVDEEQGDDEAKETRPRQTDRENMPPTAAQHVPLLPWLLVAFACGWSGRTPVCMWMGGWV